MSNYHHHDTQTGKALADWELEGRYDEYLDEVYPSVSVAGYEYSTSRALKEIDPTAYRCGFVDWLDAEIKEGTLGDECDCDE